MQQRESSDGAPVDARALYGKISSRIIPYVFFLYILAYMDRVNVGFAALEMKRDLLLSDTVYGTGAAIYFLGQGLLSCRAISCSAGTVRGCGSRAS